MLSYLYQKNRFLVFWLASSSLLSVALSFARIYYTRDLTLGFMMWNLILAIIPFLISLAADQMDSNRLLTSRKYQLRFFILFMVWLAFFPNAPYMVTDLFHLHPRPNVPLWFDLMLLTSYAWNGLILGFVSLIFFHRKVRLLGGRLIGWLFAFFCLISSSFGIYVGRYLRWNSWDLIVNTREVAGDIMDRLLHPVEHPRTWVLTTLISVFLILAYSAIHHLTSMRTEKI